MIQKMLIDATIQQLFSKDTKDLMSHPWSIAQYENSNYYLIVRINAIKKDTVWLETWLENSDRDIKCLHNHKITTSTLSKISDNIIDCSDINEKVLFNFSITKWKRRKYETKFPLEQSEPRVKRRVVQEPTITILQSNEDHLIEPKTKKERELAKLERKMFSNAKLWKYKL